jgi:4-diphosphocytidyl-2-C-methyl-D-erythritol kinase
MSAVSRRAFGKVNLALRILGRRQDGYHEISTVMAAVCLSDVLSFARKKEGLSVVCPCLPDLPQERNLVTRAARILLGSSDEPMGLDVTIEKNIPHGAGMGGGSSDAAATLLSVNEMFPQHRRQSMSALMRIAAMLGADIPFFIGCNALPPVWEAALCTGTGNIVRPLEIAALTTEPLWLVLAFPDFQVNTAQAYRDWDEQGGPCASHEVEAALLSALESGDWVTLAGGLFNDLEASVCTRHPAIAAIKGRLVACGALGACMTGSGSAIYGICSSQEHAAKVRIRMAAFRAELGLEAVVVSRTGCET